MPVITANTHTFLMSGTVAFTDGGGDWQTEGSFGMGGAFGGSWTTKWYYYYDDEHDPEDIDPVPPVPIGRKVDVVMGISGGPSTSFTVTDPTVLTGTFSISAPGVEFLEFEGVSGNDLVSFWRLVSDGAVSLTILGTTLTRTVDFDATPSGVGIGGGWVLRSMAEVLSSVATGAGSQTVTATTLPGSSSAPESTISKGATLPGAPTEVYTYATGATARQGYAHATVSLSSNIAPGKPRIFADASASIAPDRSCAFNGRIQRLQAAYEGPTQYKLTLDGDWIDSATGSIVGTFTSQNYDTIASVFEHTFVLGAGTDRHQRHDATRLHPFGRIVGTLGGNSYEQVLLARGPLWSAVSLSKELSDIVDDGTTLTPTGRWAGAWSNNASGGSVAVSSGNILVTGSAGKEAKRTITGVGGLRGWSQLRLQLTCSAPSHTIQVWCGSARWDVVTGGAGASSQIYIDMGAPINGPSQELGSPPFGIEAYYYGMDGEIVFKGLGAGDYTIENIGVSINGTDVWVNRLPDLRLTGIANGMPVLDASIPATAATVTEFVTSFDSRSLDARGNHGRGWSAADLAPTPAGPIPDPMPVSYLVTNGINRADCIGGQDGLLWQAGSWVLASTVNGRGTVQVESGAPGVFFAQRSIQTLLWEWPQSLLGGWLYGGAIGAAFMMGTTSAWGRIFDSTDTQTIGSASDPVGANPASGLGIRLLSASGSTLGVATTDADGWYALSALSAEYNTLRVAVDGLPGWVETTADATRTRVVIRRTSATLGTLLAMACSATERVCRAYRVAGDALRLEYWVRSGWDTHATSLTLSGNLAMAYDKASASGRLWLAYEDSGAIKTRYTDDEGGSFSVAVTVFASADYPAIAPSPTSLRHYFAVVGSAIKTIVIDSQGGTAVAERTAVASGVAASPIDAVHDGQLVHLTYKSAGGAIVTVVSSDGGLTFS